MTLTRMPGLTTTQPPTAWGGEGLADVAAVEQVRPTDPTTYHRQVVETARRVAHRLVLVKADDLSSCGGVW